MHRAAEPPRRQHPLIPQRICMQQRPQSLLHVVRMILVLRLAAQVHVESPDLVRHAMGREPPLRGIGHKRRRRNIPVPAREPELLRRMARRQESELRRDPLNGRRL